MAGGTSPTTKPKTKTSAQAEALGPSDAEAAAGFASLSPTSNLSELLTFGASLAGKNLDLQEIRGAGEWFESLGVPGWVIPGTPARTSYPTVPMKKGVKGPPGPAKGPPAVFPATPSRGVPMTAGQVLQEFAALSGGQLAKVQDQLYRAGYYSGSSVPRYGQFGTEDLQAFKTMLVGLAANPEQGDLSSYLTKAATDGTALGTASAGTVRSVRLTNPDEIRVTLQKTAQDLYGGFLPETDVQRFITMFQSAETADQTAGAAQTDARAADAFNAGTYDPTTGHARGASTSGTWTTTRIAAPSPETFIRTEHPNQVAATEFGSAMDQMLAGLRRPG